MDVLNASNIIALACTARHLSSIFSRAFLYKVTNSENAKLAFSISELTMLLAGSSSPEPSYQNKGWNKEIHRKRYVRCS